ncbi:NACHT, LRR and PYD domains-containing protein 3-like [Pelodytes ibericus]
MIPSNQQIYNRMAGKEKKQDIAMAKSKSRPQPDWNAVSGPSNNEYTNEPNIGECIGNLAGSPQTGLRLDSKSCSIERKWKKLQTATEQGARNKCSNLQAETQIMQKTCLPSAADYSFNVEFGKIRTAADCLVLSLEDLTSYDFKRFKDKLSDFSFEAKLSIPRGRLEKEDFIGTKNQLINTYGEEGALEVTAQVLREVGLMGPADKIKKSKEQICTVKKELTDASSRDHRIKYMECMKNKFQYIEDRNARLGETVNLTSRYTKLVMIKKHRNTEEREHEITSSGKRHLQIMANRCSGDYSPTRIENLFDPDEEGIIPRAVVLQGPAGIGKTMTAQKIMLDWASGKLYHGNFNYVFYMSCREINNINFKISLAGFISRVCQLTSPHSLMRSICSSSVRNLCIIDGFDELKWSPPNETEVCEDPFQETTKDVILNSLFRKQVLEKSSLIITVRPFTLEKLRQLLAFPRYVEVLGFSEHDREEYFYNFFHQKEEADMALNVIKENETLFTMCAVPITCWIVCTVIKQQIGNQLNVAKAHTLTSIYTLYFKSLLKYHGRNSPLSTNICIKRLSALARDGIFDQKILFEEDDIEKHGLSVSDIESVFLNENIFQRDIETHTCYSFIHLSVQEFFAALYYVLAEDTVLGGNSQDPLDQGEVLSLLTQSESQPHLMLTVRFLFGLSHEKLRKEIEKHCGSNVSPDNKPFLVEWLSKVAPKSFNEAMHCVYETQDRGFVEGVMSNFTNVDIFPCMNIRAISYCLDHSIKDHKLSFKNCTIGLKEERLLVPALHKCVDLSFHCCEFAERESGNLEITNDLGLSEEESLTWLCNSQSKVHQLRLSRCDLSSACWRNLCSVVIRNQSLVKLQLSHNELQDSTLKLLCAALSHPHCTLQQLEMERCGLVSESGKDLTSVLIKNRSLLKLNLGMNKLQDSGIQHLCVGLSHSDCTLKKLSLMSCDLTSASGEYLSQSIIKGSLTMLDLHVNKLNDAGVKHLCAGLTHPDCALQDLRLQYCHLGSSCCEDLCTVLLKNRTLTKLNLAYNKLCDVGVKHLCEGLRHPDCTLQELKLQNCGLTSSCCEDLNSIIIANRSLSSLDLRQNQLQDSGLRYIYAAVRHADCTLQTLGLESKNINVDKYRHQSGLPPISQSKPLNAKCVTRRNRQRYCEYVVCYEEELK